MAKKKASTTKKKVSKSSTKKSSTKKSPTKKSPTKKSPAKKSPTKKAPSKKSSKKAPAKKSSKKAPAKKSSKKAPVKKAPAKKSSKKAPAKKTIKKSPGKKKVNKKTSPLSRTPSGTPSPVGAKAKKKKNDRRVAPTVVPSRRKLQKKAEAESKSKTPRRKIDFANPRSVAAAAAASSDVDKNGYVVINGRRVRAISTKGVAVKKRRSSKAVEVAPVEAKTVDVSKIKTKLTKKDLDKYRDLLIQKRRAIVGMVSGLESEALRSSGGNLSNMPMHMADVGTDVFEQDFTLGMAATERELIIQIDEALERVGQKIYGICQATGKPIPKARLNAKPWAKYTIDAAREIERNQPNE